VADRKRSENIDDSDKLFGDLHDTIQNSTSKSVMKIASDKRIEDVEFPRQMQKVAVKNLTKNDPKRKEVSLIMCKDYESIVYVKDDQLGIIIV